MIKKTNKLVLTTLFSILVCTALIVPQSAIADLPKLPNFEMGGTPVTPPFIAPDQVFAVHIPPGWRLSQVDRLAKQVVFLPNGMSASQGSLNISWHTMTPQQNTTPMGLLQNHRMTVLDKLPNFEVIARNNITLIGPYQSAMLLAKYNYMGNFQYPRGIQDAYVIVNRTIFHFTFDCASAYIRQLSPGITAFLNSFTATPTPQSADSPFNVGKP